MDFTTLSSLQALPKHPGLQKYLKVFHSRSFRRLCGNIRATERQTSDQSALGEGALPPWMFGFQCNERYLAWDSSAQIQLLKIHAAREMGRVRQALLSVCIMAPPKCGALNRVLSGSRDLVHINLLFGAGIVQDMSHSTGRRGLRMLKPVMKPTSGKLLHAWVCRMCHGLRSSFQCWERSCQTSLQSCRA